MAVAKIGHRLCGLSSYFGRLEYTQIYNEFQKWHIYMAYERLARAQIPSEDWPKRFQ